MKQGEAKDKEDHMRGEERRERARTGRATSEGRAARSRRERAGAEGRRGEGGSTGHRGARKAGGSPPRIVAVPGGRADVGRGGGVAGRGGGDGGGICLAFDAAAPPGIEKQSERSNIITNNMI